MTAPTPCSRLSGSVFSAEETSYLVRQGAMNTVIHFAAMSDAPAEMRGLYRRTLISQHPGDVQITVAAVGIHF